VIFPVCVSKSSKFPGLVCLHYGKRRRYVCDRFHSTELWHAGNPRDSMRNFIAELFFGFWSWFAKPRSLFGPSRSVTDELFAFSSIRRSRALKHLTLGVLPTLSWVPLGVGHLKTGSLSFISGTTLVPVTLSIHANVIMITTPIQPPLYASTDFSSPWI